MPVMGPFANKWTIDDVNAVIERGDPRELLYVPIVVSMDPPDCGWSEAVCVRLAGHPDEAGRGNAVLGVGHLARTCGRLDDRTVKPIIESALGDASDYVRGHADSAADDVERFLGWR